MKTCEFCTLAELTRKNVPKLHNSLMTNLSLWHMCAPLYAQKVNINLAVKGCRSGQLPVSSIISCPNQMPDKRMSGMTHPCMTSYANIIMPPCYDIILFNITDTPLPTLTSLPDMVFLAANQNASFLANLMKLHYGRPSPLFPPHNYHHQANAPLYLVFHSDTKGACIPSHDLWLIEAKMRPLTSDLLLST